MWKQCTCSLLLVALLALVVGNVAQGAFDPLKDPDAFKMFAINDDFKTLSWPNGADLAPEYLYRRVTAKTPA